MIYAFGPFRLDTHDAVLFCGIEPVALGRRAVALLRALVERPGALVSKDVLIEAAWPGQAVEDSNLTVQIAALRRVLGEAAPGGDRWIETMPRHGYRFIGPVVAKEDSVIAPSPPVVASAEKPVEVPSSVAVPRKTSPIEHVEAERRQITTYGIALGAPSRATPPVASPPPPPEKPSIAVLPFQNMSGDPEQEYFVDGMVEEIITALSRIRWLFVLARNSSFSYKGQSPDVKQVGRELGVRYVLEGSVRKGGNRVRITAQLIDAATGAHLWADRFDGSLDDVFDLQDKVASSVAGVIEPALQAAETARSTARPTNDLTAYDLYLRAYAMVLSSARQIPEALRLLERAIARDPYYGPALALAATCCFWVNLEGRSQDPEADRLKAIDFARRGLETAGNDPGVLVDAAQALAFFGEDIGAMIALVDRALALNPNFARGWNISGILRRWAGQPDVAIEHLEAALRLSPRARIGTSLANIGAAHFFARRLDQAVPKLLLAIQEDPSHLAPYRYLAASYAHMGRLDDAREIVARLRAFTSAVVPDAGQLRNPEQRELLLSGLRLAMGEAGP